MTPAAAAAAISLYYMDVSKIIQCSIGLIYIYISVCVCVCVCVAIFKELIVTPIIS
jgi:hypothetical protein